MKGAYTLSTSLTDPGGQPFLLVDDILTTGATHISILRLLKQNFPSINCSVFTLAKLAYDPSLNTSVHLAGADYSWKEEGGWKVAEKEVNLYSYSNLVHRILHDDFTHG